MQEQIGCRTDRVQEQIGCKTRNRLGVGTDKIRCRNR